MAIEKCSNCLRAIGQLEQAHIYQGKIVCEECNGRLNKNQPQQKTQIVYKHNTSSDKKGRRSIAIAGLVICIIVFLLIVISPFPDSPSNSISNSPTKPQKLRPTESQIQRSYANTKPQTPRPKSPKIDSRLLLSTISKPIFGIYLGETINSLQRRTQIVSNINKSEMTDKDLATTIWILKNKNPNIKYLSVTTFNNRIYTISVDFVDNSESNYEVTKSQLAKKYKSENESGFVGAMFGEASFWTTIDGVPVAIWLNRDIGFMEDDTLNLLYAHVPLLNQVIWKSEKRKAEKIKKDL